MVIGNKHILAIFCFFAFFISGIQYGYSANSGEKELVRDFYQWYLHKIEHEHGSPTYDDAIYKYVSKCTAEKIRMDLKRGIVDWDYFTVSQDTIETWESTLTVYDPIQIDEHVSIVPVNFDPHVGGPALAVFVRKENESFKIIKIEDLYGYF